MVGAMGRHTNENTGNETSPRQHSKKRVPDAGFFTSTTSDRKMMYSLLNPEGQQPSAVGQLLSLLVQHPAAGQPGQPPPPPVAPMSLPNGGPQVSVTPDVHGGPSFNLPQPRGLLDLARMTPGAGAEIPDHQNLLGKIHDFISDRVGINEPAGYRGLLSPEEIQSAKPGILENGAGESWARRLDHILAVKHQATADAEQKRIVQSRQHMTGLFAPAPNETADDRNSRYNAMYDYALRNGDFELAKHLEGAVRTIDRPFAEHPYAPQLFKMSDGTLKYLEKGQYVPAGAVPYHTPPRPLHGSRDVGVAPSPIRTVEVQLKTAREDLRRASSVKAPGLLATDEEKAAHARVQQAIPALRQRVDSLSTVFDNMAAQQQGHVPTLPVIPKAPAPPNPTKSRDTVRSQDEYDMLRNEQHWSDAKIAQTYNISPLIKRVR